MRLLFLSPYLPSPPRWGGPRRIHGLMSGLARRHSVSVVAFTAIGEDDLKSLQATREYCDEVVTVANDRLGLSMKEKRALQLTSLASRHSYEKLVYYRQPFQAALDRLLERTTFDIVTAEFSLMAHYRLPRETLSVVDEHNIEYDILRRTALGQAGFGRRLYNTLNYIKLRREELSVWRRHDGCIVTSQRDDALLRRDCPSLPTAVVPNAVDITEFSPGGVIDSGMVLFFGAIDYFPNTDGLLFFIREVMPLLRERAAPLRLVIVGKDAPDAILREAGPDVEIIGYVDDVRPYLQRANIVVAPIRVGGGTRLKILEAMAMGKAVVSTTIGAEGISVTHGRDIMLADTADCFADAVAKLLNDRELIRRIGDNARDLIEGHYDWSAAVGSLEGFYADLPRRATAGYSSTARSSLSVKAD